MADTIKKYLDQAGLEALITKIKSEDDAHQAAAQLYADGLAKNYDAAGSAATAKSEAVAYTDEKVGALADGQVKTNKEAIATIVADYLKAEDKTELEGKIDAVDDKADANAEAIAAINDETDGILVTAKAYADGKDAAIEAAQKAGDDAQNAVDALAAKVGTVPEGSTVMGIITNIHENAYDDTEIRGLISGLDSTKADKTQVADDIAAAVKTEEEARKSADDLQAVINDLYLGYINDNAEAIKLKADQTALDEVSAVANAAVKQSDYDIKVKALEDEDARIVGLVEAEATKAREEEGKLDARLVEVEAFFKTTEEETLDTALDTLVELQKYLEGEGAIADQMLLDIAANKKAIEDHAATDHDFATADATLKSELEGKINGKVAQSDFDAVEDRIEVLEGEMDTVEGNVSILEGKVSTLEGEMDAVEAAVATKAEAQALADAISALEGADSVLSGRLDDVETILGEGEGSVADQIGDAKEAAIETAATDATEKADKALEDAKDYVDEKDSEMNARVEALEAIDHEHSNKALLDTYTQTEANLADAVAKKHVHANASELNKIADGDIAKWNATEQNAKNYADGLNNAMTSNVDGINSRLQATEGAVATKAEQENLDDAVERIAANETAIAANKSAIAAFQTIATTDIEALFA